METVSFQDRVVGKQDSFQVSLPKEETGKQFIIIYSHLLDDCLLLVRTKAEADALRRQGVQDVIYTAAEVQALKDASREQVTACHKAKKIYPEAEVST